MTGGSHRAAPRGGLFRRRRGRDPVDAAPESPTPDDTASTDTAPTDDASAPPPPAPAAPRAGVPLPSPGPAPVVPDPVGAPPAQAVDPTADTVVSGMAAVPEAPAPTERADSPGSASQGRLLSASLWMALGTVLSRVTGFLRLALVIAALGTSLNADVYTLANSVPNALYILVAGGVFNVVLVPQLIRAMRHDRDGGEAYANRVITLGLLILLVATVVLVVAVPVLVRLIFDGGLFAPENTGARESAYALMRYCMPQVFFYGAFVLVGQVLNARERFGPMMWAPIANNVLASAILGGYIVVYGSSDTAGGFGSGEEILLGVGSTLGIVLQAAILVPYLRSAGFRYRPRFDFRGAGLGHTARLGAWTLAFIVANQVSFFVVNRVASGSATRAAESGAEVAGATVYQAAFLVSQVPHGIITVSVMTAVIPTLSRYAADRDLDAMRVELGATARVVLTAIVPVVVAVACLGQAAATILTSYGGAAGDTHVIGYTISAFAPGMLFFCLHFLMLRGFYAMEDTRTPFLVQIWLSGTQVCLALVIGELADPTRLAVWLALGYGGAYLVGATLSATVLGLRIGTIFTRSMLLHLLKLAVACAVAAALMLGTWAALEQLGLPATSRAGALLLAVVGGGLGLGGYLLAAQVLRVQEVRSLLRAVARRR
ncbi:MAG: murein biosynthesis integral membrane protein MurJ [Nocardioidaceae bacterium]|nr:murein biosynthesis integral membrane protein MurJ [Nocardioidaceae bacterium]